MFEDRDFATRLELIIDLATAQRFFPTTDPIGKRVRFLADSAGSWHTIIGVVGNTRHFGLEVAPRPTLYRHVVTNPLVSPVLVIRTKTDPSPMMQTLTGIVREAHADMPAYNVFSMEQLVERPTAQRRFLMWLTTAFACAGLLLAAIGVYGAISQSVAQRTKELGVRMALGATKTNVLMLVVGEGLQIAAAGAAISVGLGWSAARLGRSLLFEVQPHDPAVYAGALLAILACAMLACYCGVGSSGIFAG